MIKKLYILLLAALVVSASAAEPKQFTPESRGVLKNIPTYVQEWHLWWGFPYPDKQQSFLHCDSTLTADGEPWRLYWNRNGYPLIGPYDSANPEVIRWQIRCMKAAGLDAVSAMLHPEWNEGVEYIQEEKSNIIKTVLDIAAAEKMPVFFMDEVAFRKGSAAQKPEVMVKRFSRFIKLYGSHPGLLKVDGKPVIYFQTYGFAVTPEQLEQVFSEVEKEAGPVYWMLFADVKRFGKIPQVRRIVSGSSLTRKNPVTRKWSLTTQNPESIFADAHKMGKEITDMQYPKFDGTAQNWRQSGVAAYGESGLRLETTLLNSLKAKPDFIMMSSWNDWEEGANFEPGWDFDGFAGDPWLYCRLLAHLKGIDFVPPPPPPKESVHPSIWEKLGYGDGAGPVIDSIARSHNRGGALTVKVRDTVSEVTALEVVWNGDFYWKAPQAANGKPSGNLQMASGFMGKAEQLMNVFQYTPGWAAPVAAPAVEFKSPELQKFGEAFAIGTAVAFQPDRPFPEIRVSVPNREPVLRIEPKGGKETDYTFNFTPHTRDDQFPAELWNGWRTSVGVNPRPADFAKDGITLKAPEQKLGLISLLGPPQEQRVITSGEAVPGTDGRQKQFFITLPESVLGTPGAHFVWLRGRDSAGNWGSPVLYAVPNYENFEREQFAAPAVEIPGAVKLGSGENIEQWKAEPSGSFRILNERRKPARIRIANGLAWRELPAPVTGSFQLYFKATHLKHQRLLNVWLTNGETAKGVGAGWDSAKVEMFNAHGIASLRLLDEAAPMSWNKTGKALASGSSGHYALSNELAEFVLTYHQPTGSLQLSVDGKNILTAKLTEPLGPLTRIYLRGNDAQLLDDITLVSW